MSLPLIHQYLINVLDKGFYSDTNVEQDYFFRYVPSQSEFLSKEQVKKALPYLREKYGYGENKEHGVLVLQISEDFYKF